MRLAPLAILVVLAGLLIAQAPPTVPDLNSPDHEVLRLRLLSKFQKALLAQETARSAQQQFEQARQEYTDLAEATAQDLKLPKGTEFSIDAAKGTIAIRVPPPPAPVISKDGDAK